MTTLTVRPSASVAIGRVRSAGLLANYATLKETYAAGSVDNSSNTMMMGQWTDGSSLELNECFFRFSLASLPAGVTVSSAVLEFTKATFNSSTACAQQLLNFSAGATVGSGDWKAASTLAALTNYGTIPATGYHTGDTTYQITLNAAARTAIEAAAGGDFDFMAASQKLMDGTPPTTSEQYQIYSDDHATSANRPALIITYAYNNSISETATFTDAASGALTIGGAISETAGLADNASALAVFASSIAEALSLTDAAGGNLAMLAALAETMSVADAVAAALTMPGAIAEAVSFTDAASNLAALQAAISDNVGASDALTGLLDAQNAIAETVGLTDAASATMALAASIAEALSLTDAAAANAIFNAALAELVSVTDAASLQANLAALIAEDVSIADYLVGGKLLSDSISEALGISDAAAVALLTLVILAGVLRLRPALAGDANTNPALAGETSTAATLQADIETRAKIAATAARLRAALSGKANLGD
jgi:hypothetical protein